MSSSFADSTLFDVNGKPAKLGWVGKKKKLACRYQSRRTMPDQVKRRSNEQQAEDWSTDGTAESEDKNDTRTSGGSWFSKMRHAWTTGDPRRSESEGRRKPLWLNMGIPKLYTFLRDNYPSAFRNTQQAGICSTTEQKHPLPKQMISKKSDTQKWSHINLSNTFPNLNILTQYTEISINLLDYVPELIDFRFSYDEKREKLVPETSR